MSRSGKIATTVPTHATAFRRRGYGQRKEACRWLGSPCWFLLAATVLSRTGLFAQSKLPRSQSKPLGLSSQGRVSFSLGFRTQFSSFTSWQLPDIDHPHINPISRLEYPWEQVVGVAKASYTCPLFELFLEGSSTALVWSGMKAQDSDWEILTGLGRRPLSVKAKRNLVSGRLTLR